MSRVYIAAPLHRREEALRVASQERAKGHRVLSTWHDHPSATVEAERELSAPERRAVAQQCMSEIEECDVLVWLSAGSKGRSGAAWEAGYALGRGLYVCVIDLDGASNVFSHMMSNNRFEGE